MLLIEGLRAYELFQSLRLHFKSPSYDFFKYAGKIQRYNADNVTSRGDFHHYRRLERRHKDDLKQFILANLVSSEPVKWVGDLASIAAEKKYADWKKRQEALRYNFRIEITYLRDSEQQLFAVPQGGHPALLRMYMSGKVSLDTMIIMDNELNFKKHWDEKIEDTVVWPDISMKIEKYRPFLNYDANAMREIMREVFLDR